MILTSENTFNNASLTPVDNIIKDVVEDAVATYWEEDVDVKLYALNDYFELRQERIAQNLNFFTTQMKVENHNPIIIRLNDEFVSEFLALALNESSGNFALNTLTPLEIKILNNFSEFLYKKINEVLIPIKNLKISEKENPRNLNKNINILYFIRAKSNAAAAKLMLTIPFGRLKFEPVKKTISFSDSDFVNSCTFVTIKTGTSKITLKDLRELEPEDIILLENSDINKSTLVSGEYEQKFNVKINPSLIINLDDDIEENDNSQKNIEYMTNEVTMEKNLWDDIEVEIGAEFEKVKMSIGELKQLTQGQVVDLGSVFESEISLYVENKKVAAGELLIINDRYAVKLNKVLSNPKARNTQNTNPAPHPASPAPKPQAPKSAPTSAKPASTAPRSNQAAKPQAPAQNQKPAQAKVVQEQKEDFDYSDFEK